jgi:hypothetical protein
MGATLFAPTQQDLIFESARVAMAPSIHRNRRFIINFLVQKAQNDKNGDELICPS